MDWLDKGGLMLKEHLLQRRRKFRVAGGVLFVATLVISASAWLATEQPAAAITGTGHHAIGTTKVNQTATIEGALTVSFTCNTRGTDTWKITVRNVQVMQSDRFTPWTSYRLRFQLGAFQYGPLYLAQNQTNGLFNSITVSGVLPELVCVTGQTLTIHDDQTDGSVLSIAWTLS